MYLGSLCMAKIVQKAVTTASTILAGAITLMYLRARNFQRALQLRYNMGPLHETEST